MKQALLTLLCTLSALAQWPTDPAQNLLICNHTGEAVVPKIAATSDGGCYVTWWDHTSGNYDVYLQRFDSAGVPQWTVPCGILVSNHPTETWLTDWDMVVDLEDYCIIAVNDSRGGSDRDIYAYRISPDGQFAWGADGITLSANNGFEPDPRIAIASNGDIAFAWQEDNVIHLRRVNVAGQDVFTPSTITLTHELPLSIPRICGTNDNAIVLSYLIQQGTQFTSPRHIYVQKFSEAGATLWNPNGLPVMTTNGIGIQMKPDIVHDGRDGAYSFWYDTRNNVHHVYVQHINSGGIVEWQENGVQVDLSASELQMSPSAILVPEGIAVFYQSTNTLQSLGGVDAQLLDSTGSYLWSANGVTVTPWSPEPCFNVRAHRQTTNYSVFYSQYAEGSAINTLLRASQLDPGGNPTWTPPIKDLCTVVSEKGRPYTCVNPQSQIIACWPDARGGAMNMYLQNINADGELGPNSVFPPEIVITSPEDSATVNTEDIDIVFEVHNILIDPNNGDGYVSVTVNDQDPTSTNEVAPYPVTLNLGWNMITMEILDLDQQPFDPPAIDSVHVLYEPNSPSIVITTPVNGALLVDSVTFVFAVENFDVSDSGGDGHILLLVDADDDMIHDTVDIFDVTPYLYFFGGRSTENNVPLIMSLRDNQGHELVPPAADTVIVDITHIIAADDPILQPSSFSLHEAYPNPFNASVTLSYDVPTPARVSLDVIDIMGRKVTTLVSENSTAGTHSIQWQADHSPSGLYFVRLTSGSFTQTQKIILLK
ncbi:MAG: T9SS type A sorting domain-containing protein [Calditrichaeota bacterium]|nr:T9SS type A sorting domain-containing protein [Calditrichota bacterium]MCB9369221.1 T9SS type A sorting domain-containing protein [Calditrichota bacterium]